MPTVEQLESLLEQDPDDSFLLYALAMELDNVRKHDRSLAIFDQLMQVEPPYVPAFFMAGQLLVRLGDNERARTVILAGIEQARDQNDSHAAGEMTDFLAMIED